MKVVFTALLNVIPRTTGLRAHKFASPVVKTPDSQIRTQKEGLALICTFPAVAVNDELINAVAICLGSKPSPAVLVLGIDWLCLNTNCRGLGYGIN